MKYAKINGTDLVASKIVMGSAEFGTTLTEAQSFELLDAYKAAGGNIIDTASFYADWLDMGKSLSEKTIGKWLELRGCRNEFIISTKGGHPDIKKNIKRLDFESVKEDFENSLINLKTDYIDIYWLHKDDEERSPEELIETLNRAAENKAGYLGVSNWCYDRIKEANEYAEKNGLKKIIASQMRHSVAKVNYKTDGIFILDDEEYAKYSNDTMNVFAFSSQAKGFFAVMEKGGLDAVHPNIQKELLNDYNLKVFEKMREIANQKHTTVAALTLAALINDVKVKTFAQIGPRDIAQLNSSLSACDVELCQNEIDYIREE